MVSQHRLIGWIAIVVCVLCVSRQAEAQQEIQVGTTYDLTWSVEPDKPSATRFDLCVDGASGAACEEVPGGATARRVRLPERALTIGTHTIIVRGCRSQCVDGDALIAVVIDVVPGKPINIQIIPVAAATTRVVRE